MFGMTRKQFLKRSKECLDAQGIHLLNISQLVNLELSGKINEKDSYTRIKAIMKDLDSIFDKYHRLKPPSECVNLKSNILNSIILLQETATLFYEYVSEIIKNNYRDNSKLEESKILLIKFRESFKPLNNTINTSL